MTSDFARQTSASARTSLIVIADLLWNVIASLAQQRLDITIGDTVARRSDLNVVK